MVETAEAIRSTVGARIAGVSPLEAPPMIGMIVGTLALSTPP